MFNLPRYKYLFAIIDFILINISFLVSINIIAPSKLNYSDIGFSLEVFLFSSFASLVFILFLQGNNLYKINVILSKSIHLYSILRSLFYGAIALIFLAFWIKVSFILDSRRFILIFLVISLVLLVFFRIVIMQTLYLKFSKSNIINRKILIIGGGKSGKLLATKLEFEKNLGISIVGFIDDHRKLGTEIINDKKVIGNVKELTDVVRNYKVDEIILAIDKISYKRLLEILDTCNKTNVTVKLTSELFEIVPQKMITEKYSDFSVINISPQVNQNLNIFFKRLIDYLGASIGLIILSPIFIVLAVLIKFSSKGPVFHKQIRIGKDGKQFNFLKFRSMTVVEGEDEERKKMMLRFMKESEVKNIGNTKIINKNRVTWIGKIIRKTSIDELPQLINVLKGEMSLVGPRPCLPYEFENYDEWQKRRLNVLPGCTGVWQVFGRSNVSFKDSVVLDLYYINNMSPWLDLQLIIKTIPVMLFTKGGE